MYPKLIVTSSIVTSCAILLRAAAVVQTSDLLSA
jgi:hypothetical protein